MQTGDIIDWRSLDTEARWATARQLLGRSVRLTTDSGDGIAPFVKEGMVDGILLGPVDLELRLEWDHPYQDWDEAYDWGRIWTIELLPAAWADRMRERRHRGG